MLIRPELMESLGGTMVVFVAAGGIAAGGLLLDRSLRPSVPGR
jgi:hypothetical protein